MMDKGQDNGAGIDPADQELRPDAPALPAGDYAIVEMMGHRLLVGLVEEVTRFGATLMQITPILSGRLLVPVLVNGSSIYMMTPCTMEQAVKNAPGDEAYLPSSVRAALEPALLTALAAEDEGQEAPFEPAFLDQGAR